MVPVPPGFSSPAKAKKINAEVRYQMIKKDKYEVVIGSNLSVAELKRLKQIAQNNGITGIRFWRKE